VCGSDGFGSGIEWSIVLLMTMQMVAGNVGE